MRRSADLSCLPLESREVPAAGLFVDINPGVWGSYPQSITASSTTLFFTAETRLGMELWASDGTPGSVRQVKDIRIGSTGSNPNNLIAAGGGIVYFSADDGTGRTMWRSDGTAVGTVKATGLPAGLQTLFANSWVGGTGNIIGWKGELYFLEINSTAGTAVWAKTSGSGSTTLADLGGNYGSPRMPAVRVAGDKLELLWSDADGRGVVWRTDGSPAGTTAVQSHLTAASPTTGPVTLDIGEEIAPGKFVFASKVESGSKASLWVGGGTSVLSRQLIKAFDASPEELCIDSIVAIGGKAYFTVTSNSFPRPVEVGVWVTDGTTAGTKKLNIPTVDGLMPRVVGTFDGRAVVQGFKKVGVTVPSIYHITDGTEIGTITIPRPAGVSSIIHYVGNLPPDSLCARGSMLFQALSGETFRTDGTAGGTIAIDTTGLPPTPPNWPHIAEWGDGKTVWFASPEMWESSSAWGVNRGAFFNGSVFYSGQTDTNRPELWKWDVTASTLLPPPPTSPAPKITGTKVNDGSAQRSMVKSLTVTFDSAVKINPLGVTITSSTGRVVAFNLKAATHNGITTLTLNFPTGVGGSIADGRYSLKITAGAVTKQTGGTAMASDYSFGFTRLFGDTSGDGVYDRDTRMLVKALLGQEESDPGYRWDLDVNGDGMIDTIDELAAIRNWGKAV